MDYVSDQGLSNLKLYQYRSVDKSYLTHYVLRHYWNFVVELFPMWMAPNLITLLGFSIGILMNVVLIAIYMPDLAGPAPSWVYFCCGTGMWLYSTFDNVDGKQARRTKTSSPLGELFDHGCDALNTATGALMQAACLGLGHSPLSTLILWTTTVPFYFSTWEEYHTGVLYLGYINGPTEGLVLSSLSMFVAGIYGPQIFHQPLHTIVPWLQTSVRGIDVLVVALLVGVFVFHIPPCVMAVYRACQEKRTSFVTALWQLMPMVSYQVAIYAWLYSPYSIVMAQHYFILFTLTVGVVFGRVATKIILAHVTKMPFPMFTVLLLPLYGGALLVNLPLFGLPPVLTATGELYYLLAYLAFAVVAYFHWAFLVIDRFCTYLDIYCLTIKHKHQE